MRPAFVFCLVVLVALSAACDDGSLAGPGGDKPTPDLARSSGVDFAAMDLAAPPDLASPEIDFATINHNGEPCIQVLVCSASCSTAACIMACRAMGLPTAVQQFDALFNCAYGQCVSPSGPCTNNSDTSPTCSSCVATAAQGSACSAQLDACESGTS